VSARPRPRRRFRNADASRTRILHAAVAEFAASGYRGASIGAIARRAGISQSGLLHHFPSKELLLAAVIDLRTSDHLAEYLAAKAEDPELGFMTGMVRLMRRGVRELDLTRLFVVVIAEATSPDHPAHEWAVKRYEGVTESVVAALREAQDRELVRRDVDVDGAAASLLAAMDGLQLRYLLTRRAERIDVQFAALAGQVLADLACDTPQAAAKVDAWRRRHGATSSRG
jgi:AcrR family transcriptional regulator